MNPNNMPDKVSKDITDELSNVDNKPNIPPVTNSNILIPVPKPIVVIQPSPPRKCTNCKCNISPHPAMYLDICETCFGGIDDEARRRHF